MTDSLPGGTSWGTGRVDRAIEHHPVALVVVAASIILPDVEEVDGGAEEKFADVVERFRPGVGQAIVSPLSRPLQEGDVQPVIVGVRQRGVLAVVGIVRVRAAAVVVAGSRARGAVLID